MVRRLEDDTNWNALFLNPNSILDAVSKELAIKKKQILEDYNPDTAVKVSLAETKIITDTKKWLKSVGISLDFLFKNKKECPRSKTTILVKNIPFKGVEAEYFELFERFGKV